jgi:hypothetical protein
MRALVCVALIFAASAVAHDPEPQPKDQRWLSYEPAMVQLQGTLRLALKYGPPNFGENPETDEKVQVPILELTEPVNVRADPSSNLNHQSAHGVTKIQLVFSLEGKPAYSDLVNQNVVLTGTLYHAHTANHYTPVLMRVETIRRATD